MTQTRSRLLIAVLAAVTISLLGASGALAATFTPTGSDPHWEDPASWSVAGAPAGRIPGAADDVDLGSAAIRIGQAERVHDLAIDGGYLNMGGGDSVTVTGHATLHNAHITRDADGEGLIVPSTGSADITGNLTLSLSPSGNAQIGNHGGTVNFYGAPGQPGSSLGFRGPTAALRNDEGGTVNFAGTWTGPYNNGEVGATVDDASGTVSMLPGSFLSGRLDIAADATMNIGDDATVRTVNLNGTLAATSSSGAHTYNLNVADGGAVNLSQSTDGKFAWIGGLDTTFASGSTVNLIQNPAADQNAAPHRQSLLLFPNSLGFQATMRGNRIDATRVWDAGQATASIEIDLAGVRNTEPPALDKTGVQPGGTTVTCQPGTYQTQRNSATSDGRASGTFEFLRDGVSIATPSADGTHVTDNADRGHTLSCREHVTDSYGNTITAQATGTVTVSVLTPAVIDRAPAGTTRSAEIAFHGADHYTCEVDSAGAQPCASPFTPAGLADGAHTVTVTGYNASGQPEHTPAQVAFTLDRVAPAVTVTVPAGLTAPTGTEIGVAVDDPDAAVTCDLDGMAVVPCVPQAAVPLASPGDYRFTVTATDAAGNTTTKTTVITVADPGRPVIKTAGQPIPNLTNPSAPASCPVIASIPVPNASWLADSGAMTDALNATTAAGIWRCVIDGIENGRPVEYRTAPVLVANHRRMMFAAETVTAYTFKNPTILSSGTQKLSVALYQRSHGRWKLGPRQTQFTQTVKRGMTQIAYAKRLRKPLGKGRYKFVVRAVGPKHKLSPALSQELTVAY